MSETSKTPNLDLESALQSRGASKSWIEPVLAKVADIEARHAEEMRTREDSYLVALGQKSNRIDEQAEEIGKLRTAIEDAKREAYEDAAKMADNFQRGSMGIAAIRFREYSAMLREKAGKR